jgi:hypothetical protein
MVPPPLVLGLTLCDYVIVEERTRKVSLIGCLTAITAERFPAAYGPLHVFATLTDGLGDATTAVTLTRLDTNAGVVLHRGSLHLPDKLAEVIFHVRIPRCPFPVPGEYELGLAVDGEEVSRRKLRVYLREEHPKGKPR